MAKLFVVGVGPGSEDLVTPRAKKAISRAGIIVGWNLDLEPVRSLLDGKKLFIQSVENYRSVARAAAEEARGSGRDVVVLRIGDPCLSSGLKGLLEDFEGFEVEVVPGISSVQLAAALAKVELGECVVVSFHDYGDTQEKKEFMTNCLKSGKHVFVLSGAELTVEGTAAYLLGVGFDPTTRAAVFTRLGLEGESAEFTTLGEVATKVHNWLSILLVYSPKKAVSRFTRA
ncbi:precorrin-6y C5,15-methyltransferase (decarboxylating) subunit CbiE [Candidatus Marsarchaeota G2 archaeon BE_D]|jgi:iron complex transport system substrate-binding protein|uniref:Precorrin-6y C5,15-methyltransferase (Decarboxylating) subunit CbiE n=1 Tax=Candidatus Marsarchaeota G2 archaeon BE_D TaxID=1978158 RepID=A0A2R6C798_9ARCH|nr:MAG: precorrin-6y C5,15-methyltransferase (decarboxylating) subunit CbiE [Candidatus Marsarchaeota G2 archaeon BE_D]